MSISEVSLATLTCPAVSEMSPVPPGGRYPRDLRPNGPSGDIVPPATVLTP